VRFAPPFSSLFFFPPIRVQGGGCGTRVVGRDAGFSPLFSPFPFDLFPFLLPPANGSTTLSETKNIMGLTEDHRQLDAPPPFPFFRSAGRWQRTAAGMSLYSLFTFRNNLDHHEITGLLSLSSFPVDEVFDCFS